MWIAVHTCIYWLTILHKDFRCSFIAHYLFFSSCSKCRTRSNLWAERRFEKERKESCLLLTIDLIPPLNWPEAPWSNPQNSDKKPPVNRDDGSGDVTRFDRNSLLSRQCRSVLAGTSFDCPWDVHRNVRQSVHRRLRRDARRNALVRRAAILDGSPTRHGRLGWAFSECSIPAPAITCLMKQALIYHYHYI